MKTITAFIFLTISIYTTAFSQNYFKTILGDETTPTVGNNLIKTDNDEYIISGLKVHYTSTDTIYAAYLAKISNTGEILLEKDSVLLDTILLHRDITEGENGNLWTYSVTFNKDNGEEQYSYLFSEYDEDFNRLKKFEIALPDSLYFHYYSVNFNTTLRYHNNQLIWADRACVKGKWEYYGFMYKFNTEGDSLDFMIDKGSFFYDIDIYDNETFYSTSGGLTDNYMTINKMNLSDLSVDSIYDTANLPDIGDLIIFDEPTYMEFLTDTTFVFSALKMDQQTYLCIMDTAFNVLKNKSFGNNTQKITAQNKGLTISNDKNIFNVYSFFPLANMYAVTKLDNDLNIVWERFFYIEEGFWLHSIEATDDGGCVILGEVVILGKYHIILLKTDENGSINGIDDKLSDKITKELILYPNPGNAQLNIRTAVQRIGGEFMLYDISGKLVFQQHITESITNINTEHLPSGAYIYNYTHEGVETENGKWVKE